MPPSTNSPSNRSRVPSSYELAELIDQVLSDWAFFSARPAGRPVEGPAPLHLEFSVAIEGPINCILVMRSHEALGADLAHASTGDPSARDLGSDAFREFCNLVAGHILTSFLGGSQLTYKSFFPQPSNPEQWPLGKTNAEIVLIVGQYPLEVRLWLNPIAPRNHA
jgi:hypothetical protein